MAATSPVEIGPVCTKCGSKMKLSHVTLHHRLTISFERHTFVCTGCGHSQTYTMGGTQAGSNGDCHQSARALPQPCGYDFAFRRGAEFRS